jgi:hypothetical protein
MTKSFATATTRKGRTVSTRADFKPSTVAEFVTEALAAPLQPPPPPPRKPKSRPAGIWEGLSPAERSAHARYLASLRSPKNMARTKRRTGTPDGWTHDAVRVARAAAQIEAAELVHKLKAEGRIAPDDTEGEAATLEALTILRSPGGTNRKLATARRLIRHYHEDLTGLL